MLFSFMIHLVRLPLTIFRHLKALVPSSQDAPAELEFERKLFASETALKTKDQQLRNSAQERDVIAEKLRELERKLKKAQEEGEGKTNRIRDLDSQLLAANTSYRSSQRELESTRAIVAQHEVTIGQLTTHFEAIRNTHAHTKALLETRTRELAAAQVFLDKEESFTEKEIIDQVRELNYEISQVAVTLADSLEAEALEPIQRNEEQNPGGESEGQETVGEHEQNAVKVEGQGQRSQAREEEVSTAIEDITMQLGPSIAGLLQVVDHTEDPLLLEIVFQSYIANYAQGVTTRWHFGADTSVDEALGAILTALEEDEPAAISGRWRTLTRRYAQKAFPSEPLMVDPFVHEIARFIASCLLGAGSGRDRATVEATVLERAGEGIREVISLSLKLNKAVGEGITSSMISPIVIEGGEAFDIGSMEESYSDNNGEPNGEMMAAPVVMCTTSIGLRKRVQKANGRRETTILLKPQVALETVIIALPKREK
ncbi:hypothetical protein EW146_g9134 [Bondarzewia mesenterica]|uniref:Uncharacterized protein n=1 Tax=Bondarzewia mesenterica TaxID=1095465 RepID=A0A4S4L8P4_9AGAM|nr:hypothetical protein EW146_g9134 [Bondarzewia mesenterica]